jgi:hypothetical protein
MYIGNRQGINTEFLMVHNWAGIHSFNGTFQKPEFSYKINQFWLDLDQNEILNNIASYNDPRRELLFFNIPILNMVLVGNYKNGLDPGKVRWTKWTYPITPDAITLFGFDYKFLISTVGTTTTPDPTGLYKDHNQYHDLIFIADSAVGSYKIPDPFVVLFPLGD